MIRPLPLLLAAPLALSACAATAPSSTGPGAADVSSEVAAAPRAAVAAVAAPPTLPVPAELAAAAKQVDADLHAQADAGFARRDGYTYGMDVATLLLYAARRNDAALYEKLLPAAQSLVLQSPDDPYTNGFVLVRTKDGAKPATSGAAEALWMARALWAGAAAFNRDADRELALAILDGYAKHAYVLQNVWLARRSFDFGTRSFSGLSSLTAYQPDFLAEAERAKPRAEWRGFAERSYGLLERAATPAGLLYPVIQPEVGATFPGAGLDAYAPNGLTPLEDSCRGVEGAAAGLPRLAGNLLALVAERGKKGRLRAYYNVDDASAAGEAPLSADGEACLVRVASALNHADALGVLDARLAAQLGGLAGAKGRGALAASGPLLLAAQARGAF